MITTRCCKITADEMGVAEFGPKYSCDGRYQAGGFNLGRVHDPVYAAVRADGHTLVWLEIVSTNDAIVTSLRSYAMVPSRLDRAIITRSIVT